MMVGDSKDVVVPAGDGYGEKDSQAYMEVPRNQFPEDIPMEIGTQIELHDEAGHPMVARIDQVGETSVRLDFNHPLAGKELHFAVKIAGLRLATQEEMDHGHVHSGSDALKICGKKGLNKWSRSIHEQNLPRRMKTLLRSEVSRLRTPKANFIKV